MNTELARKIFPAGICFLGFVLSIFFFYPGFMSHDSFSQLLQARSGDYDDWHPPLMAFVWRQFEKIKEGPSLMLFLQESMLWLGLYLVSVELLKKSVSPIVVFLVCSLGLFPPVFLISGVIWKDLQFGSALLLAFALLIKVGRNTHKVKLATAFILLLYAVAMRYNGLPALFPLFIYFSYHYFLPSHVKISYAQHAKVLVCSALLLLCVQVLQGVVSSVFLKPVPKYVHQFIFAYDFAGMHRLSPEHVSVPELIRTSEYSENKIQQFYSPLRPDVLFFGGNAQLKYFSDKESIEKSKQAWLQAIREQPTTYLKQRWQLFSGLIGASGKSCFIYTDRMDGNSLGWDIKERWYHRFIQKKFAPLFDYERYRHSSSVIFLPLVWALCGVLALLRLWVCWSELSFRNESLVLLSSGYLFLMPYFFVTLACDYRYVWWSVVAFILGSLLSLPKQAKTDLIRE